MKEKFQCEITERKGDHKARKRRRNMEIKLCPALIKSLKFAAPLNSLNFMDAIGRCTCAVLCKLAMGLKIFLSKFSFLFYVFETVEQDLLWK